MSRVHRPPGQFTLGPSELPEYPIDIGFTGPEWDRPPSIGCPIWGNVGPLARCIGPQFPGGSCASLWRCLNLGLEQRILLRSAVTTGPFKLVIIPGGRAADPSEE